jgi:hypothetical protein
MRLDRGPRSSLDEDLLATCLKALTSYQFLAELVASPAACEPICMNQAARRALLAAMPMLDDVDITMVQRATYTLVWRFSGPTSPTAWAMLPMIVAALSSVAEAVAQQAMV